jgi:hypothetical protein
VNDPRDDEAPLVVAEGRLVRGAQSIPATLKNLVEVVQRRYRDSNITLVGFDDVVIPALTLRWGRRVTIAR